MGGGALYDVGCYPVSLARLLLGEPRAVTAQARWTPGGVDLGLSGTLDFGGTLASIDCAFDWGPAPTQRLTVVGTQGSLELDGAFESHNGAPLTLRVRTKAGERREAFALHNGYAAMVAHFGRVVRGEEEARFPPQDAVRQARVLDALFAAAREGRTVTVG